MKKVFSLFLSVIMMVSVLTVGNVTSFADDFENSPYAYVSNISITSVKDGTGPFDSDNEPGNDSSSSNDVVRSFDKLIYDINTSMQSIDTSKSFSTGKLCFNVELPADITKARFDVANMKWLTDYTIEYFDKDGNSLAKGTKEELDNSYRASDEIPGDGKGHSSGNTGGADSYTTPVVKQVLSGSFELSSKDGTIVIPGTQSLNIYIQVLAATNGTQIQPTFCTYVENNKNNIGGIQNTTVKANPATVSSKLKLDVRASTTRAGVGYSGVWDLDCDDYDMQETSNIDLKKQTDELTSENKVVGKMYLYTLEYMLKNDNSDKGLKGLELPIGDITCDLSFTEKLYNNKNNKLEDYAKPVIWDYGEDDITKGKTDNHWHRNPTLDGRQDLSLRSSNNSTPYNKIYSKFQTGSYFCYNGGSLLIGDLDESAKITNASTLFTGGNTTTVTSTLSNYDFNFDNSFDYPSNYNVGKSYDYAFPLRGSSSGDIIDKSKGFFATDIINVIFPVESIDEDMANTQIEASFTINKVDENGNTIKDDSGKAISTVKANSISGMINKEKDLTNNGRTFKEAVFSKGVVDARSSFTKLHSKGYADKFLGVSWWQNRHSDAASFLGDTISMWGVAQFNTNYTDNYPITQINLLQKFDTKALSIAKDESIKIVNYEQDKTTILYGADATYPNGYDSNKAKSNSNDGTGIGGMDRINSASFENFKYYSDLESLENDGYTCSAILVEFKGENQKAQGWGNVSVDIPVKVTDDENMLGKTVCTVCNVTAWTQKSFSQEDSLNGNVPVNWENAVYDSTEKISVLSDYITPNYSRCNGNFVKSEWENGVLKSGTPGGADWGDSLLLIDYNSKTNISPDKTVYDFNKGEQTVTYTVSNSTNINSENNSQGVNEKYGDITNDIWTENPDVLSLNSVSCDGVKISKDSNSPTRITYDVTRKDGTIDSVTSSVWYETLNDTEKGNYFRIHYSNVAIGYSLPNLLVTAKIGNKVNNNQSITSLSSVRNENDTRSLSEARGNLSKCSFTVSKLAATATCKEVSQKYAEPNDEFTYTIKYDNNGNTDLGSILFCDNLPLNHDYRGTSCTEILQVKEINIECSDINEDIELYISKDTSGLSYDNFNEDIFNSIFDTSIMSSKENINYVNTDSNTIRSIGIKSSGLAKGESIIMTFTVKVPKIAKANDIYKNSAVFYTDNKSLFTNVVSTEIVSRSISGNVWEDTNENGLLDDTESLVDTEVTLLKEDSNGNYQKVKTTNTVGGHYEFSGLTTGTYIVAFDDDNLKGYFSTTKYEVGDDDSINNKASESSDINYLYQIKRPITFVPAADMTNNNATVENQNLGLIKITVMLPDAGTNAWIFVVTAGIGLMLISIVLTFRKKKSNVS